MPFDVGDCGDGDDHGAITTWEADVFAWQGPDMPRSLPESRPRNARQNRSVSSESVSLAPLLPQAYDDAGHAIHQGEDHTAHVLPSFTLSTEFARPSSPDQDVDAHSRCMRWVGLQAVQSSNATQAYPRPARSAPAGDLSHYGRLHVFRTPTRSTSMPPVPMPIQRQHPISQVRNYWDYGNLELAPRAAPTEWPGDGSPTSPTSITSPTQPQSSLPLADRVITPPPHTLPPHPSHSQPGSPAVHPSLSFSRQEGDETLGQPNADVLPSNHAQPSSVMGDPAFTLSSDSVTASKQLHTGPPTALGLEGIDAAPQPPALPANTNGPERPCILLPNRDQQLYNHTIPGPELSELGQAPGKMFSSGSTFTFKSMKR